MTWISVKDEMPPDDLMRVLFCWRNEFGKHRTALGRFIRARTEESQNDDCDGDCADCSWGDMDDNGQCWKIEGWYEEPHESEYYYNIFSKVTHWARLPAPPE